jgi:hemoglobin
MAAEGGGVTTLYEKYGGYARLSKVVRNFYDDVVNSPRLAHFFTTVDMETLIRHQTAFLSQALGGPIEYSGRQLFDAHAHLTVTHADFLEVAQLLSENLRDAGVEAVDVDVIMANISKFQGEIVDSLRSGS